MIIVSNNRVAGKKVNYTYQQFVELAFSDAGLDSDGDIVMINIHDMEEEIFDVTKEVSDIGYFTLTGTAPGFCDRQVEDWSDLSEDENRIESNQSIQTENHDFTSEEEDIKKSIAGLLDDALSGDDLISEDTKKDAKVFVFGSSKGGTGKTFTAIISAYRYAKTHPHQKIALVDFDIIDGQVGISIHKVNPTLRKYYTEYQKGYSDFRTMKEYSVKANPPYPQNVDFYLAPSGQEITNYQFWLNVIQNVCENYDVVVFDTGIDYINIPAISFAYKTADKVILVTTTSIKSVNSVTKQIGRLKGEISSRNKYGEESFTKEDGIAPHLNVVITQMLPTNEMNGTIYNQLSSKANVIATFGVITDSVSRAEFYGEWDVFDKNNAINNALDDIMS